MTSRAVVVVVVGLAACEHAEDIVEVTAPAMPPATVESQRINIDEIGPKVVRHAGVAPVQVTRPAPVAPKPAKAAAAPAVPGSASAKPAVERRGPHRATNVTRPAFGEPRDKSPAAAPAPVDLAKAGNDEWESF